MKTECDPTNTGILPEVQQPPKKDKEPEAIWTIDGPKDTIEVCWGLRRLIKGIDCSI